MNTKNGKIWRFLAIGTVLFLAFVSAVYAYGRLNHRVETLEKIPDKVGLHERAIIKMETDIQYIKASVTRIEGKLDESK